MTVAPSASPAQASIASASNSVGLNVLERPQYESRNLFISAFEGQSGCRMSSCLAAQGMRPPVAFFQNSGAYDDGIFSRLYGGCMVVLNIL